jgi:hypothetical protein
VLLSDGGRHTVGDTFQVPGCFVEQGVKGSGSNPNGIILHFSSFHGQNGGIIMKTTTLEDLK